MAYNEIGIGRSAPLSDELMIVPSSAPGVIGQSPVAVTHPGNLCVGHDFGVVGTCYVLGPGGIQGPPSYCNANGTFGNVLMPEGADIGTEGPPGGGAGGTWSFLRNNILVRGTLYVDNSTGGQGAIYMKSGTVLDLAAGASLSAAAGSTITLGSTLSIPAGGKIDLETGAQLNLASGSAMTVNDGVTTIFAASSQLNYFASPTEPAVYTLGGQSPTYADAIYNTWNYNGQTGASSGCQVQFRSQLFTFQTNLGSGAAQFFTALYVDAGVASALGIGIGTMPLVSGITTVPFNSTSTVGNAREVHVQPALPPMLLPYNMINQGADYTPFIPASNWGPVGGAAQPPTGSYWIVLYWDVSAENPADLTNYTWQILLKWI